ncbi:MAG: MBL fold metallo-hydrolase [Planctomycetes bacterium]|nr:MBL fold metallo-hydrolase [Planctomycetota bacterium]MCB9879884.1 MBL fold metallo-hydrolase [Planctomycetota bacterium]MCB9885048.1 MBL fold metallo-hydrolase [Planctomycetota bacterium]
MNRHDPTPSLEDRLYFRQWLAGRDFAVADPIAGQMANFVYAIGDKETGEVVLVDPCYAVGELVSKCEQDGMRVTGALATHYHPDHVGGDMYGHELQGVKELLTRCPCKVHAQREEAPWIKRITGCSDSDLQLHDSGDVLQVGAIPIQLIHTPGHTPGSQCFLVQNRLVAGDTLFLQGCGRTDLPGGDPRQLYLSLTQKLAQVPDDATLYPGHLYAPEPSASLGETRKSNFVFKPKSEAEWLAMFG